MSPHWLLALAYLLMGLGFLHLGLLAANNDRPWHQFVPLIQSAFAIVTIVGAFFLPQAVGLLVQWIGLAGLAGASTALTLHSLNQPSAFTAAHALQSAGLLVAAWCCVQWWLSSGGVKIANRLALGYLTAALGATSMLILTLLGQGHPVQRVQRPYAAADDALLLVAFALAAWTGRHAAKTLRTPEPVFK